MDRRLLLAVGMLTVAALCAPAAATPMDAPWGLVGAHVSGGVQLSWNAPVASPVSGYRVYRALNETSFSLYAEVTTTAYLDPDGNAAPYSYYVTAVYASTESSPSNEVFDWPSCRIINVIPFDLSPNPTGCLFPVPWVGTPFIYRIPIVGSVPT